MIYDEFLNQMMEYISGKTGLEAVFLKKGSLPLYNEDVVRFSCPEGLAGRSAGTRIGACVRAESLYRQMCDRLENGLRPEALFDDVAQKLAEGMQQSQASASSLLPNVGDYEKIRGHLYVNLMNAKEVEGTNAVYKNPVGDIAMVAYIDFGKATNGDYMSARVLSGSLCAWGKSAEEVFADAMANTEQQLEPVAVDFHTGIMKMMAGMSAGAIDMVKVPLADMADGSLNKMAFGCCVTAKSTLNGGSLMFLPGIQKQIARMAGGDYYFVFTSAHEAMVHSMHSADPEGIRDAACATHAETVGEDIFVSDKVYLYDSASGKVVVAVE